MVTRFGVFHPLGSTIESLYTPICRAKAWNGGKSFANTRRSSRMPPSYSFSREITGLLDEKDERLRANQQPAQVA